MKKIYFFAGIFALALAVSGCNMAPAAKNNFAAELTGSKQVPAVATTASGTASFWLSPEGTELHYKLSVSNLDNVTKAHLHWGAAGENGPPVAWLYSKEVTGISDGVLNEGTITASDLAGPLAGKTIADLVAAIRAHDIYVNVHTQMNPDGEIRGQLR